MERELVRVLSVKVSIELRVSNEAGRDPRPLLGTVALPVNQILHALPSKSRAQEALDSVNWTTFHHMKRQSGRHQGTFKSEFDFEDVERGRMRMVVENFSPSATGLMTF